MIGSRFVLDTVIVIYYIDVQPFSATLAMLFRARGLASMVSTVAVRLDESSGILALGTKIKIIDGPKVNDLVITPGVLIAVAVVIMAFVILHRTRTGRTVYAIGGSEQSAALMGLRSEEHTSELQSRGHLVCRLLLEKKKKTVHNPRPE